MDDTERKKLTLWLLPTNSRCEFLPHPKDQLLNTDSPLTMMALKDKLVGKGLWAAFYWFANQQWIDTDTLEDEGYEEHWILWLLNPARFGELVAEFIKRGK